MTDDTAGGRDFLNIGEQIARSGFCLVSVGFGQCSHPGCQCEPEPDPWAYTVGWVELGLAELVIVGLAPQVAHALATGLYDAAVAGADVGPGTTRRLGAGQLRLDEVPDAWLRADINRMGRWFATYGPPIRGRGLPAVVQPVWSDAAGRFPDDPGCDPFVVLSQPLLARDPIGYPARPPRAQRRAEARHRRWAA